MSEKRLAYLNEQIMLAQLVDWAENCLIEAKQLGSLVKVVPVSPNA